MERTEEGSERMMKRIQLREHNPEHENNPIRKHLKTLVRNTENFDLVFETMLKNGVFNEYIAYNILKEENERDRKKSMYEELANGGPGCVAKLCSCFLEVRLSHLVKHLDPKFNFLNKNVNVDESGDSEVILGKLDLLVKGTEDLNLILPKLISKRAFDAKIRNLVQSEDENEKKIKLYILTANCGPIAVNKLCECYRELELYPLEELLRDPFKKKFFNRNKSFYSFLTSSAGVESQQRKTKREKSKSRTVVYTQPDGERRIDANDLSQVYKLTTSPKGFVLLISMENNIGEEERIGMNIDTENITTLWKFLGYQVIFKSNLSKREFEYEIKAFSYMYDLYDVDSGGVFVMSHGESPEEFDGLWTRDRRKLSYSWIVDQFTAAKCPQLDRKPKMFFFYTCSGTGDETTGGILRSTVSSTSEPIDTIIVRCNTSGCNTSLDSDRYGSCLMEAICEVFREHAQDNHLEKLLKYVDQYLKLKYEDDWDLHFLTYESRSFNMDLYFHTGS